MQLYSYNIFLLIIIMCNNTSQTNIIGWPLVTQIIMSLSQRNKEFLTQNSSHALAQEKAQSLEAAYLLTAAPPAAPAAAPVAPIPT